MSEMREGTPEWALAYMEHVARITLIDEGKDTKELRNAVKIIRAALAEAEARGRRQGLEWQPIETAPTDNTPILAWGADWGGPKPLGASGKWWMLPESMRPSVLPTHWMPLPVPPSLATAPAETQKPEETA